MDDKLFGELIQSVVEAGALRSTVQLPEHPCYIENGEFDHDYVFQDDSFDHEYGVERIWYYRCQACGATADID